MTVITRGLGEGTNLITRGFGILDEAIQQFMGQAGRLKHVIKYNIQIRGSVLRGASQKIRVYGAIKRYKAASIIVKANTLKQVYSNIITKALHGKLILQILDFLDIDDET